MVITLFTPGFVGAQTFQEASTAFKDSKVSKASSEQKVSQRLLEKFDDKEKVTFLVKFKEKADTKKAVAKAKEKAQRANLSAYQAKQAQRSAVISELKAVAMESQANVLEFLEQEKKNGTVDDVIEYFIVNGIAVTGTKEIAEKLADFPEVESIIPSETRQLIRAVEVQEAPKSQSENIEWNVEKVKAPDVWALGIDGTGIVVASIDTGVDWEHPALKDKYRGYNPETGEVDHTYSFYDPVYGSETPHDIDGHGTHVTGTMVGAEPDGTNQIGMAPGAKWISVQAFTPSGGEDHHLLQAGQWIMAPGGDSTKAPDVVNNSWGGGPGIDEWYREMVERWRDAQIFPVFAAGNTNLFNPGGPGSVATPANYPESFAVGATDINDNLASFSLRGPSPYDEIKPEVSAPGVAVRSSIPGGGYTAYNGTSMAAPAVSGVVALLKSANTSLDVDTMEQILMNTARPMTNDEYPSSPNNGYGYGIVNAFDAVAQVAEGLGRIQGQVTKEGDDSEPPTFSHEPVTETFSLIDLDLSVEASDNISVTKVELNYQTADGNWHTVEAKRTSGNYLSGEYTATIPGEDLTVGTMLYNWTIKDFGNNDVVSENYTLEVKPGISNGYEQDFEDNIDGWHSFGVNDSWEWGVPTSGPNHAISGEKVFATVLDGNYPSSMNATLVMPPIDLPEEGQSFLQFKHWHNFEMSTSGTAFDYGRVVISTDMNEWEDILSVAGQSSGWENVEIDLSEYMGQRIFIGFKAYSDGSVTREGWYIDDVKLSETSVYDDDVIPPTYEHFSPEVIYEGLDVMIDITVFDDVKVGSATLSFLNADNEWMNMEATLKEGGGLSGVYSVTVPAEEITGDTFTYKWIVSDFAGNEVETEEFVLTIDDGITNGYFEDFESRPVGWQAYGDTNVWERGIPTTGPEQAVSGENVFATDLNNQYPNRMNDYLQMPVVVVPEGEMFLEFKSWHNFEQSTLGTAWDYGRVLVSTDFGDTWTQLHQVQGTSDGWEDIVVDLSQYSGQRILVAFYAYSDGSVQRDGWYIDDVQLTDDPSSIPSKTKLPRLPRLPILSIENHKIFDESKVEKLLPTPQKQVDVKEEKNNVDSGMIKVSGLPLSAQVTVLETGISAMTNPADGSFTLIHPEGEFTVKAETYGFASQEQTITVVENEVTEVNFELEEIPQFTINGVITNENTGEPVTNATILLVEDANISPVKTNDDGEFALTGYEGEYTLKIFAKGFYSKDVEVVLDQDLDLNIELEPLYTIPGDEIGYDDGTAENARVWYDSGNAWAVKMSLPEGKDSAIVTDGVFQFHGEDWPVPGDTPFAVEVWSAGEDGMPAEKLAGPIDAEAIRSLDEWTVVDLREYDIQVNGDFFMVYVQKGDNPYAPGLATDENGAYAARSFQRVGGAWSQSPASEGNYMIRARVAYEVEQPIIITPGEDIVTNENQLTVTGLATPTTTVKLLNNGEEVGRTEIGDNREFSFDIELTEGVNELMAVTIVDGEDAKFSDTVTVTLDTVSPDVLINSPSNGDRTNRETIAVEGNVFDDHLDKLFVNGLETAVSEDGQFSRRVILDEGENVIEVMAIDLAGNTTIETVTVSADYTPPVIENLTPTEDKYLDVGQTVLIEFDSEPGLQARFVVHMPLTNIQTSNATELPMMEISEGHYVGYWTIPSNVYFEGAVIEVKAIDSFGNESRALAEGKIYLSEDDGDDYPGKGKGKGKGKGNGNNGNNGKGKGNGKGN